MGITNNSIDFEVNNIEIAMSTAFSNRNKSGIGVIPKMNGKYKKYKNLQKIHKGA